MAIHKKIGLGTIIVLSCMGNAFCQTTATWSGAVDRNYANPGNWDINAVPINDNLSTYNVVIPASASVDFAVDGTHAVTDLDLQVDATLSIARGETLEVLDDARIAGVIDAKGGTFTALQVGAQFVGNRSRFFASNGGKILTKFAGVYEPTRFFSVGSTRTLLESDGIGSLLDLASVQTFNGGFNDGTSRNSFQQVIASTSGAIDLSGVQTILGPRFDTGDRLDFILSGGTIDLSSLERIENTGNGFIRFRLDGTDFALNSLATAQRSQFDINDGADLDLPALETLSVGDFWVSRNSVVSAKNLVQMRSTDLTLENDVTFDAPNLRDVQGSFITLNPTHTFNVGAIDRIENARFTVMDGATFGTALGQVIAKTYSSTGTIATEGTRLLLKSDGVGSLLDLSSVQTFDGGFNDGTSRNSFQQVIASTSGAIDLSGVQTILGPRFDTGDRLDFILSGGTIDLSSLERIANTGNGFIRFRLDGTDFALNSLATAQRSQFDINDGADLDLPALETLSVGDFWISRNSVVSAKNLLQLRSTDLNLENDATFDAPNLRDVQGSFITLNPTHTLNVGAIDRIENARFTVMDGATFGTALGQVIAKTYSSTGTIATEGTRLLLKSDGVGSLLDLSSVQTFDGGFNDGTSRNSFQQVIASTSGAIDLSGVQTILGPRFDTGDRLDFIVSNGGTIDLSSLQSITSGNGRVTFNINSDGRVILGDVAATKNTNFNVFDVNSNLTANGTLFLGASSELNVAKAASVTIGGDLFYEMTDETHFNLDDGTLFLDGSGIQFLEAGGQDLGKDGASADNFGIGRLVIGDEDSSTTVMLLDLFDNGNRVDEKPESLYLFGLGGVDGLNINAGSTLVFDGIQVYALWEGEMQHLNAWFSAGETRLPFDGGFIAVPEPSTTVFSLVLFCFATFSANCPLRRNP